MCEHRREAVLSRPRFILRQLRYLVFARALVGVSLAVGVLGYMHFAD